MGNYATKADLPKLEIRVTAQKGLQRCQISEGLHVKVEAIGGPLDTFDHIYVGELLLYRPSPAVGYRHLTPVDAYRGA